MEYVHVGGLKALFLA